MNNINNNIITLQNNFSVAQEQNLYPLRIEKELFYFVIKDILPGKELLSKKNIVFIIVNL